MSENDAYQVGRFYTGVRRLQIVIGTWHDGTPIPGGPYTLTQIMAMVIVGLAGWFTQDFWDVPFIVFVVFWLATTVGVGLLIGKLPAGKRSLVNFLNCLGRLISRPALGRWKSRPVPPSFTTATSTEPAHQDEASEKISDRDDTAATGSAGDNEGRSGPDDLPQEGEQITRLPRRKTTAQARGETPAAVAALGPTATGLDLLQATSQRPEAPRA